MPPSIPYDGNPGRDKLAGYNLAVILASVFTVMLGVGIIAPLLPRYARSLGANGLVLGLIFSIFSLCRTCATPLTGILSDRWGRKYFMVTGLVLYCFLSLAYVEARSTTTLVIVRALHGTAAALVVPVANAYVGDLAPPAKEGRFMGFFLASFLAGYALGPALGGILYDRFGMAWCFFTLGILAFLAFLLTLLFLPPPPRGTTCVITSEVPRESPLRVLRSRFLATLLAFAMVSSVGRSSLLCFLPLLAQEKLGMSATLLGAVLTTNLVLAAVFLIPFGLLADRVDRKGLLLAGTFLSATMFVAIPYTRGPAGLLLVNILLGLGGAVTYPATQAMVVTMGRPTGMGTVLAFLQAATGAGFAAGPLLSGIIYKDLGIDGVFYGCAVFLAGAGVLGTLSLHPPPPEDPCRPPAGL